MFSLGKDLRKTRNIFQWHLLEIRLSSLTRMKQFQEFGLLQGETRISVYYVTSSDQITLASVNTEYD